MRVRKMKEYIFTGPNGDEIIVEAKTYPEACAELVLELGWGVNEPEPGDEV